MPLEYTLTGLSMKSPSPENSMISSIRSSMLATGEPEDGPVEVHVLATRQLRVEPCAQLEQRGDSTL